MCAHMQGEAELAPFDPFSPQPKMIHKGGYQPRYFVVDSFEVRGIRARAAAQRFCAGSCFKRGRQWHAPGHTKVMM
jgi:hypothetical protein